MRDRRLELRDVAGYLPYGLKVRCHIVNGIVVTHEIVRNFGRNDFAHLRDGVGLSDERTENVPILRPLSDLYRTITHEGMEIVPIVELARISYPARDWFFDADCICARCAKCQYCVSSLEFRYIEDAFRVGFRNDGYFYVSNVFRQHSLFDYLHELKMDYRGLIDAGLAVSVHDVEGVVYG